MRALKTGAYILAVIILQTVVFARLNFLGVMPDLVLVSVVAFAVLGERAPANLFAAGLSFIQDLLSAGIYLNTIVKLVVNNIIGGVKENYSGDEYSLTAGLVALFTPVQLIIEGLIIYFFFAGRFSPAYFIFKLFCATLYNLMLVPLIFPVVKELNRAE
jgi:rod shape-determining protein MreD